MSEQGKILEDLTWRTLKEIEAYRKEMLLQGEASYMQFFINKS